MLEYIPIEISVRARVSMREVAHIVSIRARRRRSSCTIPLGRPVVPEE